MDRSTGNPVFDYAADFRRLAQRLQQLLLSGGLLLLLLGLLGLWLCELSARTQLAAQAFSCAGALLFAAVMSWGFYWRRKLRRDFRKTYGPAARGR